MQLTSNHLPTKASYKGCLFVIMLLLTVYILENSPITSYVDSFTFNYILKPIIWTLISLIVWKIPRIKSKARLRYKGFINFWAFNFAIIYIIITVFAGVIDSLGKSPYSHSLKGIITNILFVASALVGREFIRSYLVNSFTKEQENYLVFILVSLLMTITNFSLKKFLELDSLQSAVMFSAEFLAPEFAHNIFATYLVFLGGPLTSIIYLGIIQGFYWLSPILPDLKWITSGLVGVLCPIFFLMTLQTIYLVTSKQIKKRDQNDENPLGWILTSILSISIIWFAVGVFPIYPSVIATGSMEPMIKPGDVILVKKITDIEGVNSLKVGDVIQFKRDTILISHRVIEVVNDEKEGLGFRTKGDNNSAIDSQIVKPQDLKGTIEHVVPKIGWPTLLIKSDKDINLEELEF